MSKKVLSGLFRLVGGSGKRSRSRSAKRSSYQLTFEPLESRLAPAVAVWTGGAVPPPTAGSNDPDWSNARNWQGLYVPQAGDDKVRGMPNFNLQEEQIDQLVDFLAGLE